MTDDPARLLILNDLALSIITAASIAVLYICEFESGCGTAERGAATIGEPVTAGIVWSLGLIAEVGKQDDFTYFGKKRQVIHLD